MDQREFLARGLKYHIVQGNWNERVVDHELINDIYRFWHRQWIQTFQELKGLSKLYSDDFIRQSEISFITHQNRIVSFFAHAFFDLRLESHRQHSYFKSYPTQFLEHLESLNLNKVMTMGWLCVDPTWRKAAKGTFIAQLQAGMAYKRFEKSEADTLITFTRNDRKVNDLAYLYGSICFLPKWKEHNVEVDVVYTLKSSLKNNPDPLLHNTRERLWNERIIHADVQENFLKEKRTA